MLLGFRSKPQSTLKFCAYASLKLVHVRTITLSCVVGFKNYLIQMIIMTKQCVMNKNPVGRSKVYVKSALKLWGHISVKPVRVWP